MHTRFRKSALNDMELEAIKTRLSKPILGKARSATATLRISLWPYNEFSIIFSDGMGSLSVDGKRIETHAMREPSVLYFVDKSKARFFNNLNGSVSPLLEES